VVEKFSLEDVRSVAERLGREDIEAVAVACLYSFVDPTHERIAAAEIRKRLPQRFVSLSDEV